MTDIGFVRKVLEFVEQEHEDVKHDQGVFIMTPEIAKNTNGDTKFYSARDEVLDFYETFGQNCGTAACIAGTACLLDPDTEVNDKGEVYVNGQEMMWDTRAAELLGVNERASLTAHDLFWEMDNKAAIEKLREHLARLEAEEANQ